MDFVTIGKVGETKVLNILVITDHFTKYAHAYVTLKQTAQVVTKSMLENYLVHYGWPSQILTESSLIKELCSLAQTKKIHMTPYRPEANGACKCFNATLINMIGTLNNEDKKEWSEWVSALTYAYNCTVLAVSGFTLYYLMFGWGPIPSIDV